MRAWRAALLVACAFCVASPPARATWLPGAPVDNTGGALHSVALGSAPDGSSVVAWVAADSTAGHTRLDVAVLEAGTWVVQGAIDTGSGDVTHPAVALRNGGGGVVTFVQSDGNHQRLWAATVNGSTFGAPVVVDAGTTDVVADAVVVDDSGTATAAFVQFTGARLRVLASRGTGGSWSAPVLIDAGAGLGNAQQTLAIAQSGGGVGVAFLEGSGSLFHAFVARYTGATWAPPAQIDTGAGDGNSVEIDLAMTSATDGVAAWTQYLAGRLRVYGAAMSGGVWSVPNVLDPTSGPPGYVVPSGDAASPAVSADATSGTAVVVWTQSASGRARVFSARLSAGTWQSSTPLDAADGGDAANPAVAIGSPSGDGAALWYGWDASSSSYHIFAASLANGLWAAPRDLGPATGVPVVAITGTGDVLALWIDAGQVVQAANDNQPPVVALSDCTIDSGHDVSFTIGPADPPAPCANPATYQAKATDDVSGVARVLWDFGDGTTSANPTELHHYVKSGNYQLRLSAWDGAGNTDVAVATITVADHDGPILSAGSDLDVLVGAAVPFSTAPVDPDSGVDTSSISWDLGDGATASGPSISHVYTTPGTYTVTVSASDLATPPNTSSDSALVHVHPATVPSPPANLSAIRNPTNAAPQLAWDQVIGTDHYDLYRDGSRIATVAAPGHTYTDHGLHTDGSYRYQVTAVTSGGATSARSGELAVAYDTTPPVPAIPARILGAPGVAVHFTAVADEPLSGAAWQLGDGSATGLAIDHVYAAAGTYPGSVTITDLAGNTATLSLTIVISNVLAAEAGANRSGRVGDVIRFDGSASGAWTTATWAFGDGKSAATISATHAYARTGSYVATLTVRDGAGHAASDSVRVEIAPRGAPTLRVWPVPASFAGDRVPFRGHATAGERGVRITRTWWTFGDGSKATGDRAAHAYRRAGRYTVFYWARDSKGRTARARLDLPVPRLQIAIRHASLAGKILTLELAAGGGGRVTVQVTRGGHVDTARVRVAAGVHVITVRLRKTRHGAGELAVKVTLRRTAGASARSSMRV
jgi:PKD repeat protein